MQVIYGDIFKLKVDAIVNPANVSLLRGGGLCGLIHRKAGAALEMKCKTFGNQVYGQAITTPSYSLINCDYIIHACGPRWINGEKNEEAELAKTHCSIIDCAKTNGITSIAIPAISTGIYKFPVALAAEIAITSIADAIADSEINVYFVMSEQSKYDEYSNSLMKLS